MHELSIAQNIIEIVQQSIGKNPAHSVKMIRVTIGKLTNILPKSLQFCFHALIQNTDLENARLNIHLTPIQYICDACRITAVIDDWFYHCTSCGSPNVRIISGTELLVQEIELRDNVEEIV